ncbi:hypothetical protein ACJMK2_027474 [Sinanodonta woodiana]|uniref:Uncharacterized protein n=1 Tax=Sinanodonta woodiana TaxID=1069815 RepID=A0ABD3XMX1_SINWO
MNAVQNLCLFPSFIKHIFKKYANSPINANKFQTFQVNKDGLQYAAVVFGPPSTRAGKPVIHGLEDCTVYADIDYGKRGKPLPDSDEEKESSGTIKNNGTQMNIDE